MRSKTQSFAEIGDVFNDATTSLVGGITPRNEQRVLNDLGRVQESLQKLIDTDPDHFQGVAGIHAQSIVDQIGLERDAIQSIGSDPFAAKYINDVQRDLIDIVQGDDVLSAMAREGGHNGFAAVPDLLADPAQFPGNAVQVEFMQGFVTMTQDFADRAVAIADGMADPAAAKLLIADIESYGQAANAFTIEQGGLYSARFNNEFAENGVNGTASRAMIDGLENGDAAKIKAAADVLLANATDVASNMLGLGGDRPDTGNGIPDQIDTLAMAGTIFNDATTKLIGGVYSGNQQSIHDDLVATRDAINALVDDDLFSAKDDFRLGRVANLIDKELAMVDAGGTEGNRINKVHQEIIEIIQNDAALAAAADEGDANGFQPLPATTRGHAEPIGHGGGDDHHAGDGQNHHHITDHGFGLF